jgi:hypothetical protein
MNEYEDIVCDAIRKSISIEEARRIIQQAKDNLNITSLSHTDIQKFWINVYGKLDYNNIREVNHDLTHKAVAQAKSDIASMLASGRLK